MVSLQEAPRPHDTQGASDSEHRFRVLLRHQLHHRHRIPRYSLLVLPRRDADEHRHPLCGVLFGVEYRQLAARGHGTCPGEP